MSNEYAMDESCYYCKHNIYPLRVRDENKNMCCVINNKGWSSEEIRNCPYRDKGNYNNKGLLDYIFDWIYYGTDDYFLDIIKYIFRRR